MIILHIVLSSNVVVSALTREITFRTGEDVTMILRTARKARKDMPMAKDCPENCTKRSKRISSQALFMPSLFPGSGIYLTLVVLNRCQDRNNVRMGSEVLVTQQRFQLLKSNGDGRPRHESNHHSMAQEVNDEPQPASQQMGKRLSGRVSENTRSFVPCRISSLFHYLNIPIAIWMAPAKKVAVMARS